MSASPVSPAAPRRVRALPATVRATLTLALVSLLALAAFGWPLLTHPAASSLGHAADAPWVFAAMMPALIAIALAELSAGGVDAKSVALLGVLSAVGAALRPLGASITGFQPMFVIIVLGGRVLGPGFGFVLGSVTMFSSALLTGGVGPWLPFQMIGAAWVGLFAGLLPRATGRTEVVMVAAYGAVSGVVYGILLNLWFWPFMTGLSSSVAFVPGGSLHANLVRLLAFSVATSLGWDMARAIGTGVLVLFVGGPLLRALRRATRRAAFGAPVTFSAPAPAPGQS
jgi:energy-coupling factor transport system substrate-specific component